LTSSTAPVKIHCSQNQIMNPSPENRPNDNSAHFRSRKIPFNCTSFEVGSLKFRFPETEDSSHQETQINAIKKTLSAFGINILSEHDASTISTQFLDILSTQHKPELGDLKSILRDFRILDKEEDLSYALQNGIIVADGISLGCRYHYSPKSQPPEKIIIKLSYQNLEDNEEEEEEEDSEYDINAHWRETANSLINKAEDRTEVEVFLSYENTPEAKGLVVEVKIDPIRAKMDSSSDSWIYDSWTFTERFISRLGFELPPNNANGWTRDDKKPGAIVLSDRKSNSNSVSIALIADTNKYLDLDCSTKWEPEFYPHTVDLSQLKTEFESLIDSSEDLDSKSFSEQADLNWPHVAMQALGLPGLQRLIMFFKEGLQECLYPDAEILETLSAFGGGEVSINQVASSLYLADSDYSEVLISLPNTSIGAVGIEINEPKKIRLFVDPKDSIKPIRWEGAQGLIDEFCC
jgi:hypothetical protein